MARRMPYGWLPKVKRGSGRCPEAQLRRSRWKLSSAESCVREKDLHSATTARAKESRPDTSSGKTSFVIVGLSIAGVMLLATKVYFIAELTVILLALAVLFTLGAGALLLLLLLQEGACWGVRKIIQAKQRTLLPRGAPSFRS